MDIEKIAIELNRLDYAVRANISTAAIFTRMIEKYRENPVCSLTTAVFLAHVAKTYIARANNNNDRITQLMVELHEEYKKLFGHEYGEDE